MKPAKETKSCKNCGAKIYVTWEWNGKTYVPKFFNEGEVIENCYGCGEWLSVDMLEEWLGDSEE